MSVGNETFTSSDPPLVQTCLGFRIIQNIIVIAWSHKTMPGIRIALIPINKDLPPVTHVVD